MLLPLMVLVNYVFLIAPQWPPLRVAIIPGDRYRVTRLVHRHAKLHGHTVADVGLSLLPRAQLVHEVGGHNHAERKAHQRNEPEHVVLRGVALDAVVDEQHAGADGGDGPTAQHVEGLGR